MVGTIGVGDLLALSTEILLDRRVNDKFFSDRVARELPAELVCTLFLLLSASSRSIILRERKRG